ncbi:TonB-dependent receptor domain-containing protein [Halomonas sp.]|uniref:TonB-dependent receptor domain-containing protein n=1 Tax=Halomonas sp. TaxID=1486246 RepID=UPI00298D6493|nr:TonB-dependent receptor [Halomonas sp.]MDW7746825.1 TonB-dependent receptor [Halomonas sp.]
MAFIAAGWAGSAQAETEALATMIIEGSAGVPGELSLSLQQSSAPAADAGDWLRRINGIEAVRMGGHGLELVIRGQQGNAVNILVNGGFVFGGCPNRMDTPTAYAPLHSFDHVMDNTSLRDAPMMKMRSPTESDTLTWKSMVVQQLADSDLRFGVNVLQNERDARIINDTADKVAFLSWPDVTTRQFGVFAELDHYLGERTTLSGGLRLDYSEASADAADQASDTGVVAADLYRREYGVAGELDHKAWLAGGFLRGEQRLNDTDTLYASLSRAERDADATERYFAKGDWVGNPGLDPEVHHQLEVGIERRLANGGVEVVAFADRVDDYIFRDTVDGVSVCRNIDATLNGVELSGDLRWAHHRETRGQLSWVRGDNLDDGGALADIAPLRGQLSQFHVREVWEAGLTARFSDAQDRLGPDEVALGLCGAGC